MTLAMENFMGPVSHGSGSDDRPRERLSKYLNRQYQGAHRRKALAADIARHGVPEVTEKTAENILNGHWPSDLHLAAIVGRFGRDIWDVVFAPEIDPVAARLRTEARELEEALEAVRQRQRQVEGGLPGGPERLVATEARAISRG